MRPGHLIISNNPQHSAKELCEHPNSLGPDLVSTVEGIYCDMVLSEWLALCSAAVTNGYFDSDSQTIRSNAPGHKGLQGRDVGSGREIPEKSYKTSETWSS